MTTIAYYECDVCGKRFEDEDECAIHEFTHDLEKVKDNLFIYDEDGTMLPLDPEETSTDTIYYVRYFSKEAWETMVDWFKLCGNGYGFEVNTCTDSESGLAYYNIDSYAWENADDILALAEKLNTVLKRGV